MKRAIYALLLGALAACNTNDPAPVIGIGVAGEAEALRQLAINSAGVSALSDSNEAKDGNVQTEVTRAAALARTPGLVGIVGHSSSRATLAVAPIYREHGLPMLVPSATSRLLKNVPNAFLLAPNDSIEGEYMVRFAIDSMHATRAWILFVNDAYGIGLRDGLTAALASAGVPVLGEQGYGELSDHGLLLDALLKRSRPDVIFVAGRVPDARAVLDQLATRAAGVPVLFGDGAGGSRGQMQSLYRPKNPVYITSFWWPEPTDTLHQRFVKQWESLTGVPPGPADALRRDAIYLLAAAVHDGQHSGAAVTAWLKSLGVSRPPFSGVSGSIAFTAASRRPLVMLQPFADSIRVVAR
jgi:ABC-type branched-subunit amino acid transport system substrate-binding protein